MALAIICLLCVKESHCDIVGFPDSEKQIIGLSIQAGVSAVYSAFRLIGNLLKEELCSFFHFTTEPNLVMSQSR